MMIANKWHEPPPSCPKPESHCVCALSKSMASGRALYEVGCRPCGRGSNLELSTSTAFGTRPGSIDGQGALGKKWSKRGITEMEL